MKLYYIIAVNLLFFLSFSIQAQQQPSTPQLSERHKKMLDRILDPEKKAFKYIQFFKKDSAEWAHDQSNDIKLKTNKRIKSEESEFLDQQPVIATNSAAIIKNVVRGNDEVIKLLSIDSSSTEKAKQGINDHLIKEHTPESEIIEIIAKDSINGREIIDNASDQLKEDYIPNIQIDSTLFSKPVSTDIKRWKQIAKDTISTVYRIEKYPGHLNEAKQLKDSTSLNYIGKKLEKGIENSVGDMDELEALEENVAELDHLNSLKDAPDDEVKNLANEEISEQLEKVNIGREQLEELKKKYSSVVDSNDLTTAEKRNSLKGKKITERLVFSGNFQIQNYDPVTLDFSPMLGYRVNKNFHSGIGLHWRHTFRQKSNLIIPSSNKGYKAYAAYDIAKGFFVYSEYEQQQVTDTSSDDHKYAWKDAWHIGMGRSIRINKFLSTNIIVMYNILHDNLNPLHSSRWNMKVGLQVNFNK